MLHNIAAISSNYNLHNIRRLGKKTEGSGSGVLSPFTLDLYSYYSHSLRGDILQDIHLPLRTANNPCPGDATKMTITS